VYFQYGQRVEEDGFQSLEEAEAFLRVGEDVGSLSSRAVVLGDGTVLRERTGAGLDYYSWP
jgi:hypothetical protein